MSRACSSEPKEKNASERPLRPPSSGGIAGASKTSDRHLGSQTEPVNDEDCEAQSCTAATTQAHSLIESELHARQGMDTDRRGILKAALAIASRSAARPASVDLESRNLRNRGSTDETPFPPVDVLHFMLEGVFPGSLKTYC